MNRAKQPDKTKPRTVSSRAINSMKKVGNPKKHKITYNFSLKEISLKYLSAEKNIEFERPANSGELSKTFFAKGERACEFFFAKLKA